MKLSKMILASVVVGALATTALADTTIGVVDVKAVFSASKAVQSQKAQLQSQFKAKHEKLLAQQKQLQGMIDQYKRNKSVMNKEQLQKLQTQISAQQSKLLQLSQMYSQQADQAQGKAMESFVGVLRTATAKVAAAKGLTLVLPNTSVIYSKQADDITQAVEKQINS